MNSAAIARFTRWISRQGAWRRISIFLLMLIVVWAPAAALVYLPGAWLEGSNIAEIVVLALLYIAFLLGLPWWGRWINQWSRPFQHCGLMFRAQTGRDMALALVIGVLGVFSLFGIEALLGWATPSSPSPRIVRFVIEGLIMALAVGLAEELLFRGWLLAELEQNYSSAVALVMNALFFAGTHFIKPWSEIVRTLPQFLGLFVLAMALVWARRSPTGSHVKGLYKKGLHKADIESQLQPHSRQAQSSDTAQFRDEKATSSVGSLGYPIGLHAGLIWGYYIVNVGGLIEYTGRAPTWITGIDNNPLAGLLGVILLGLIARQFAKTAKPKVCL
ncbi:MAG: type II CAAX endopeptidase family protein [Cyanobacteria bacterium J06632_3]